MNENLPKVKKTLYSVVIKRVFDIVLSGSAIVVLSPVLLIICILELIFHGWPVVFVQKRPGLNGKIFNMYKFRSMTNETDENGNLLPDEVRLTTFGKKLRASSLDELPELVNILKGDMSVIGPRPLLVRYLPYYTVEEFHRHDVCPGLTGLAQVNGRNFVNWEKRFAMDIEYVTNISFLLDLKIIIMTIKRVLERSNIMEADVDLSNMNFRDLDVERRGADIASLKEND